jgi:hypothetical protein
LTEDTDGSTQQDATELRILLANRYRLRQLAIPYTFLNEADECFPRTRFVRPFYQSCDKVDSRLIPRLQ